MDWAGISTLIGSLGVFSAVVLAVVNSRMKRQEEKQNLELERARREMDLEFDRRKKESELQFIRMSQDYDRKRRADNATLSKTLAVLYGYLNKLLNKIDADRVFIFQPHPLSDKQFLSVSMEVNAPDRGISTQKSEFQSRKISEWGELVSKLAQMDWIVHTNVDEIRDRRVFTEAHIRGVKAVFFKRMVNEQGEWIGTLVSEYIRREVTSDQIPFIKEDMNKKAGLIQVILPEYHPADGYLTEDEL